HNPSPKSPPTQPPPPLPAMPGARAWRSGRLEIRLPRVYVRPPRAQIRRNKWTARQLDAAVMEPGDYGLSGVRARPRPEGFAAHVAAARGAGSGGKRATPSVWIRRPAGPTATAGG
ncbi:unnamed protein product, partial [Urochloa humidicola]